MIPGRVAYQLGIKGPALATDTACSSSLVSLSIAVSMMGGGKASLTTGFACGCNIMLDMRACELFQAARMLAFDGRCKAMDAAADGFARGEAITSFALAALQSHGDSRLSKGDMWPISVIRGVSINQDGRSSRLTAPNGPAQTELIADALRDGNTHPHDVQALMLHGTGTPLGDPIEIGAALRCFASMKSSNDNVLQLCACKTVVAHSEAAAGTVSLAIAVNMASRAAFPTFHLRNINGNVARLCDHGAIHVSRTPGPTMSAAPVIGISSFASQGTNCHIVVAHDHFISGEAVRRHERLPWAPCSIWYEPARKTCCCSAPTHQLAHPAHFPRSDSRQDSPTPILETSVGIDSQLGCQFRASGRASIRVASMRSRWSSRQVLPGG